MSELMSFAEEILENKEVVEVSDEMVNLETVESSLDVRPRGGYIADCELTSPSTGDRVAILYSETDLSKPKVSASHRMVPAGPSEDIGGQHGYDRWSDHHEFPLYDGPNGEKQMALQAQRSDSGLAIATTFQLTESTLTTHTTISNPEPNIKKTSQGERLYFSLAGERFDGLTVNGKTLDELLGDGSLDFLVNDDDGTLVWSDFGSEAVIHFPVGHSIKLSAGFTGDTHLPVSIWIWHRKGTPSICFEPVVGLSDNEQNDGIELAPYGRATLSTRIELL